jgi:hypothetical protein
MGAERARYSVFLYSNGDPDDRKAVAMLANSKIPYTNLGPDSEISTPYIKYGHWYFLGLNDIHSFVDRWESGTIPQI